MKKLIYLLVFTAVLYPQQNEKIIAKIGNISISENEFKTRYELVPRINSTSDGATLQSKKNFLYGLITEKLLSYGAQENRLDTIETVRNTINTFEKMFIRDGFYKKVVTDKSKKYADELLAFYIETSPAVHTRFIVNKDSAAIQKIWKLLNKGVPFDTVYESLTKYEKDTSTVYIGQFEDKTERMIFSLNEKSTSKPVKIDDGWYIFNIVKKRAPADIKSATWETDYKQMLKTAKTKAENKYYREYMSKFFADKKVEANGFLLKSFAEKVAALFEQKNKVRQQGQNLYLEAHDIPYIELQFGADSLKMIFVKLPGKNISLKEYLQWYRFENFSTPVSAYRSVAGGLNSKTKKFIEQELLYNEAVKHNIQNDPAVKSDVTMWKDSYLAQIMASAFNDSVKVSGQDIKDFVSSADTSGVAVEVNIAEVLTDKLEVVEEVLNQLRAGTDIHALADMYSLRENFKKNRGESGFVSENELGDISRIASSLNIGDVYGPVKVPEGYSVFKIIDKRKAENGKIVSANDDKLKEQVRSSKVREKLHAYTYSQAGKYKIDINEEELSKIRLSRITTLVYRYLGFGSRITAVPFNASDIEWVKKYKESDNF